jgi:CheY-like chemotaxis protein
MPGRKNILICDDQQRFITKFRENHGAFYDIREETDIRKLMDRIKDSKPDLILLDLFHPKDDNKDFEERRLNAEKELKCLDIQIQKTKEAVEATWMPMGLEILKDIRENYSTKKLPVIIYSQRGLLLINDDQVRFVEELDGYWMVKNEYSARTEKTRMDRIMAYTGKSKPILQFYRILLIASWSVFVLIASILFFNLDIIWDLVIGIIGGLITLGITKFIEKF